MSNDSIFFYDAFISYRHVEPDKTIAKKLHKLLENFKTPKSLVAKGAPSKITRVFRDEDELPTSTSLSDSIKEALEHSRYLIVICSEETPRSKYVAQEIEIFKALGRSDRIITLLIGERAEECFPEELKGIKPITVRGKETEKQMDMSIEPLAANIHSRDGLQDSLDKLRRTERFRLLAPLLGCLYDDLYQRHRRRKTKIVLLGSLSAIVLTAFIAVVLISNRLNAKGSAQGNLVNEVSNNLDRISTVQMTMNTVFDGSIYCQDYESKKNDLSDIIIQGTLEQLDGLYRDERFEPKNMQVTQDAMKYYFCSVEVDSFYDDISMIENFNSKIIDNLKELQRAIADESYDLVPIRLATLNNTVDIHEIWCQTAALKGFIVMVSCGVPIDKINEHYDYVNTFLGFELEHLITNEDIFMLLEGVIEDYRVLVEEKSLIANDFQAYTEQYETYADDKIKEMMEIKEDDSYTEMLTKLSLYVHAKNLEGALEGLDCIERQYVNDENPDAKVIVDTARLFLPVVIRDEISYDGGWYILSVEEGSEAERIGLQVGDVIVSYDGHETLYEDSIDMEKIKAEKDVAQIRFVHFEEDGSYVMNTKTTKTGTMGIYFCPIG